MSKDMFDETNFILRNFSFVIDKKLAGSHKPGMSPSNLENDLKILQEKGINQIISMSEAKLDKSVLSKFKIEGYHFHVKDYYPPSQDQFMEMMKLIDKEDKVTLVHCNAGMGRTGTVLAAYLIYKGTPATEAISSLRKMRKGSIQTNKQEDSLKEFEKNLKKN